MLLARLRNIHVRSSNKASELASRRKHIFAINLSDVEKYGGKKRSRACGGGGVMRKAQISIKATVRRGANMMQIRDHPVAHIRAMHKDSSGCWQFIDLLLRLPSNGNKLAVMLHKVPFGDTLTASRCSLKGRQILNFSSRIWGRRVSHYWQILYDWVT